MSEQGQFDLCPKCGAVASDGVCQSCGYEIPDIQDAMEQTTIQQIMTETATMQQTDNGLYTTPDVYETQTGQDVYQTPDMTAGHRGTGGLFSGDHAGEEPAYQQNTYDSSGQYGNSDRQYNGGQYRNANNQYGGGQYTNASNQYNGGQYGNTNYQYGSRQYGNVNNQFGNGQYGNANNQFGCGQYGNANNQFGNGQYQYGNNQYGNNQYNNQQYGNPYGPNPYVNNPYSPYAVPPAKKHTGLIIGVIIAVAILFLIAILAVFYHLLEAAVEGREVSKEVTTYVIPEDSQDDDNKQNPDDKRRDDDIDDDDIDDDYADNNDDDDIYYDDDEYYTLQDDIKNGLSYSIDWEYYEYEPDDNDVMILIDYPVIVGNRVPNLDKINEVLAEEIAVFTEYYEDEYAAYMDEDSYFYASATGYVTYMSEDVMSVVFSENVYSDYYDSVYCYSINIDMQDGVIMDNTDIIAVDDDFSVDFRYRSEEQNGTIDTLDWMSDQEITELLTSSGNLIIYYTPMGMEIGFNYDEGWVTVTYHDYKDYLKIF